MQRAASSCCSSKRAWLPDELVAALDVIRCNASEAAVITGIDVRDVASARQAAHRLRERGARAGCVGHAALVLPDDELWLPHQGLLRAARG